ncbi:MAG: phosphodiester glycosidase family protein, partial [Acidobacteriota bacterium]
SKDTTYLYLVQVDGRQAGWSAGMNVWELVDYLKSLGVYQAMHLDSGGSATMVVRNQLMNNPSDGPGNERSVANSLMVISTLKTEALSKLIVYPQKVSVFRGGKLKFRATGSDKNSNPVVVDASQIQYSCNPLIGTIDNSGNFTSSNLNTGSGYVYVKYNGFTDSALVSFKPITNIILSPRSFTTDTVRTVAIRMNAYDNENVQQTIAMSDLKWSYSDGNIGSVDISGVFRAKKEGLAKLIADYSGIKDTLEVNVVIGKDIRLISEMEDTTRWTISGENIDLKNTKLSISNDVKSSGKGSLKVDYSFTFSKYFASRVFLDANPPLEVYGVPDTLYIDGRSDSTAQRIICVVSDDNAEAFRVNANMYMNSSGSFSRVTIPFKNFAQVNQGSVFNFPVSIKRIQVELGSSRIDGETYSGTFYLDNLRARYPLQTTGFEENFSKGGPESFALKQNYPNPFNPSTMIEFTTKEFSHVSLKVYDILGREISVLMDKDLQAGSYKVSFNAQMFSSGVYFYRLQSGSMVQIRKMMLVR